MDALRETGCVVRCEDANPVRSVFHGPASHGVRLGRGMGGPRKANLDIDLDPALPSSRHEGTQRAGRRLGVHSERSVLDFLGASGDDESHSLQSAVDQGPRPRQIDALPRGHETRPTLQSMRKPDEVLDKGMVPTGADQE